MLEDIKKTLWATADKLRANMDAAEYKHLMLGPIFVKYISEPLPLAALRSPLAWLTSKTSTFLKVPPPEHWPPSWKTATIIPFLIH